MHPTKAENLETPHVTWQVRAQFLIVQIILGTLKFAPRSVAIACGILFARFAFLLVGRLRRVALRNLELAFPEKTLTERKLILHGVCRNLGRLLGEFSQLPKLTQKDIERLVVYDGLEHYLAARARGKGVLFLTGHLGAWELSAFAHAMFGHPMNILVRRLDNPLVERLVEQYRTCSGNRTLDKNGATRAILTALRNGETVGILADLNMVRNQGIFCNFFGLSACSTPMLATLALRTGAAVVPGFLLWEASQNRYRLYFQPAVDCIETGDPKRDIEENTAYFMKIIEDVIRQYPDQWLWIHRRWKTRPDGEPELY